MIGSANGRLLAVVTIAVAIAAVVLLLHGPAGLRSLGERRAGRPVIGMLAMDEARPVGARFAALVEKLEGEFELREVELGAGSALDSLDVLLVLGSGHLPDARLYEVDQFLMRGGRAAFLLDGARLNDDATEATVVRGNIFSYVESYGVSPEPDLVVDPSGGSSSYGEGEGPYAFWPVGVPETGKLARRLIPRGEDVVFSWTSSLVISDPGNGDATVTVLAKSTADAWTTLAFTSVARDFKPEPDPAAWMTPNAKPRGNYPLAVVMQGTFRSAFDGKPVIVEKDGGVVEFTDPAGRLAVSAPTRLAVLGSSRMFEDSVVSLVPANLDFIENLVVWLSAR